VTTELEALILCQDEAYQKEMALPITGATIEEEEEAARKGAQLVKRAKNEYIVKNEDGTRGMYKGEGIINNVTFIGNSDIKLEVEIFKNPNYKKKLYQTLPRFNLLPETLRFRVKEEHRDPERAKKFLEKFIRGEQASNKYT
jgi:hypothetical protein